MADRGMLHAAGFDTVVIARLTGLRTETVRISAMGRKQRFKLRYYRKAPAKAIAAAPERPASGNAM